MAKNFRNLFEFAHNEFYYPGFNLNERDRFMTGRLEPGEVLLEFDSFSAQNCERVVQNFSTGQRMKLGKMPEKVFLVLVFCCFGIEGESSWSIRMNNVLRRNHLPLNLAMKDTLGSGVQLAINHCQQQFKWDLWNCPENVFSHGKRSWGSTREFAFVLAITSAAIDYTVTQNCSAGHIKGCGCNPDLNGQTEEDFVWGGCSDYPEYGENVSKKFLDEADTGMDAHTFVNLHNYEIGREVVRQSLKKLCKCHGLSGSCTVKSCWMQMASFRDIAEQLKIRYKRAIRIDFDDEGRYRVGNSVSGNTLAGIPKADTKNLIYLQKSPNYCRENNTTGWKGTKGRSCSRRKGQGVSSSERKSCQNVCKKCGHEVRKTERKMERHCNCSFQWCCEVKCERCTETVTEHFCT